MNSAWDVMDCGNDEGIYSTEAILSHCHLNLKLTLNQPRHIVFGLHIR
jgi:hypothetical protein